ncbi:MAG: hypothetical protein RL069_1765, partial [Planctomycetota bacterium]
MDWMNVLLAMARTKSGWCIYRLAALCLYILILPSCGFGPRALVQTRLPYNEAVKRTSEEQFLLNIVRLRYT